MSTKQTLSGYDSAFEEEETFKTKIERNELREKKRETIDIPSKEKIHQEANADSRRNYRRYFGNLSAYSQHVLLVNQYLLYHPGATAFLQRDTSKDKRDIDVIRENHKFLWDSECPLDSWGQKLAKKYYDKLFKEYCICDLSRYKENKVGMRWRIQKEVIDGKGQFICGGKKCSEKDNIRTWEMNFAYIEDGEKKNALVKLRLCHDCSYKLNYHHKRKELKHHSKRAKKRRTMDKEAPCNLPEELDTIKEETETTDNRKENEDDNENNAWKGTSSIPQEKDRDKEFEDYLEDLFF